MKQFLIYAAAVIALVGCSDDPDPRANPDNKDNNEIRISALLASVNPSSRTVYDNTGKASWANGDQIGLFCAQAMPSPAVNLSFTVTGLPTTPVWTPTNAIYWADASTQHTFLAYAPYASGNTQSSSVKLPSLATQTGGAINSAQDFLISNNVKNQVRTGDGSVALNFTHALSLIEFQITTNSSIATGTTLKSVGLTAGPTDKLVTSDGTSTIDLATGAITPATGSSTTANTISLTPSSSLTLSSTATNFFIVVLPGTYALSVQIALTEGGLTVNVPTATIASTAFAAGSKYVYTVAISRTGITLSNPTITDWTSVPSGSVGGGI